MKIEKFKNYKTLSILLATLLLFPIVSKLVQKDFSLIKTEYEGDPAGSVYTYNGSKSIDMYYSHMPDQYFENIICFTPINPKEMNIKQPLSTSTAPRFCKVEDDILLKQLRKDGIKKVKAANGVETYDHFSGGANLEVKSFTVDDRGMATYNKIEIDRVKKLYW